MTVRAGVVGLGFMGRTHVAAYQRATREGWPCRLAAVCDPDPARLVVRADTGGNIATGSGEPLWDEGEVSAYTALDAMFADERVDLVSVCVPTDLHEEVAVRALRAGKHVLVEKPVALSPGSVRRIDDAAREAGRVCMPAMCIRFWPAYRWVRERIVDGSLGAVVSARFERLGARPGWTRFYADESRSGGALFDLHVHDTDFVCWCFGTPDSVSSIGTTNHLTTQYRYANGPSHVVAEGGWSPAPGFGFRMRFAVCFEDATADFDLARDPQLLVCRDGAEPVELAATTGYDEEIRHLVRRLAAGSTELDATMAEAEGVVRVLLAERESLRTGRP